MSEVQKDPEDVSVGTGIHKKIIKYKVFLESEQGQF
jgi:hypothetical protein